MALSKDNDNLMGVDTTTYNRIELMGTLKNGSNKVIIKTQKFSSEEYRRENPKDFKEVKYDVELTEEEQEALFKIYYGALKREIEGEDC